MATTTETISIPNRALVLAGLDNLDVKPWPLILPASDGKPVVPAHNVLVRVRASGICGSDIHFWKEGRAGPDIIKEPFVIGHECAGEIYLVGDGVELYKVGDRVAIKPAAPCLKCDDCTTGQSNLCRFIKYFGVPGSDGSCCTMKLVPEEQLVRLTPTISWTAAGLIQPLAIAVQMSRQADLRAHQNIMIFGAGCIGVQLGAMAYAHGAKSVTFLEKQPHRAEFAKRFTGGNVFVNPERLSGETTEQYSRRVAKDILDHTPGLYRGFDVCIEATGAEECMQMGITVCRPGGTYVQVGIYDGRTPQISMMDICSKQMTVKGTWRYTTNCFEEAVNLIDKGMVDAEKLVSHVYEFERAPAAFEAVHKLRDVNGKPLLKTVILHTESN
ncbi:chlorophyll synthesis pathway protein BchC [Rhinocladiella mackenziei CBS 650.93]|uniref:D-xylulose reductase n=1 Tax=Rhinocladiella mackenziei CBS 650.93 TaxID=1442369 RepID=A0A0D2ICK6_9EURO|nr:chlorophyll synthesis pathway protein BchC [Rhinocladiella mackenziei CBS 650.93]KIX03569.1 chlorophyll synthesis pathway protein BchC [Rhinocladiella mackenziei CBS 650.93]